MQKSVIPKQQEYRLVLVDTWLYWVSIERYWLIYDGTGSVEGGTGGYVMVLVSIGHYLLVLDQQRAVMVDT